jgi:hypothetical protein
MAFITPCKGAEQKCDEKQTKLSAVTRELMFEKFPHTLAVGLTI